MFRALMLKELRETGWIALVGLVLHFIAVEEGAGYHFLTSWYSSSPPTNYDIPIVDGNFTSYFCCVSITLALALGLRQTVGESRGGTWLFLLHRPASLRQVLAAKLATGMALYLTCGLISILSIAVWSATPGMQAGPFFWWMTYPAWSAWIMISLVYLAAFLVGIRPARWLGTRLLPLAACGFLAMLVVVGWYAPLPGRLVPIIGYMLFLVDVPYLIGLIHYCAKSRDFS